MNLYMTGSLADRFKSDSQKAGNVTEAWGADNFYCPNCSSPKLDWLKPGTHASDYKCPTCGFWFQLKSKKSPIGSTIRDGAYRAMMDAIRQDRAPSYFFLHYEIISPHPDPLPTGEGNPVPARRKSGTHPIHHATAKISPSPWGEGRDEGEQLWLVRNLLLVPHFAFPPSAIVKCPPLSPTARRAGWVGCNFDLNRIPTDARIAIVKEKQITPPSEVREQFQKVKPFANFSVEQRGWLLDVLNVVRKLGKKEFTNQDIYAFESHFKELHPNNNYIRDKIRQQLQDLARAGFLIHAGRNDYRLK